MPPEPSRVWTKRLRKRPSSDHAKIVVHDGTAEFHDLGSKNGTRANDQPLTGAVPLADGDRIGIGRITVISRRAEGGLPTESQASDTPAEPG